VSGDAILPAHFDRVMSREGRRPTPEWEMKFPGFTYRLWRVSPLDEEILGHRWAWEARAVAQRAFFGAATKGEAELRLRRRIMDDLGPLVGGLGRFVQQERDWCYACGQTLPGATP
jgi:hypothetical protein